MKLEKTNDAFFFPKEIKRQMQESRRWKISPPIDKAVGQHGLYYILELIFPTFLTGRGRKRRT